MKEFQEEKLSLCKGGVGGGGWVSVKTYYVGAVSVWLGLGHEQGVVREKAVEVAGPGYECRELGPESNREPSRSFKVGVQGCV